MFLILPEDIQLLIQAFTSIQVFILHSIHLFIILTYDSNIWHNIDSLQCPLLPNKQIHTTSILRLTTSAA